MHIFGSHKVTERPRKVQIGLSDSLKAQFFHFENFYQFFVIFFCFEKIFVYLSPEVVDESPRKDNKIPIIFMKKILTFVFLASITLGTAVSCN